jgi:gallidermin/nisin family lantibiotic
MTVSMISGVEVPVLTGTDENNFDLDVDVAVQTVAASTAITSKFVCTPGCTSPGGGSFCSYCC